jgi:hypothetical protein
MERRSQHVRFFEGARPQPFCPRRGQHCAESALRYNAGQLSSLRNSAVGVTQRRKPTRVRPTIDDAYAAIKKHRALTPAALALGVSRGSLDRQVSRSSRLSWLVHQMREEVVDLAETQFARKIQDGSERCILHALSSPIARSRGWGAPASDVGSGAAPSMTLIGRVVINAVESGRFIDGPGDEALTIDHEGVGDIA